jgi:hypothetical protein
VQRCFSAIPSPHCGPVSPGDLLALSLAGPWLLWAKWRSWACVTLAAFAMLAAIYTRQSYLLAAPLAGAVWLWHNDRRRSTVFALGLASLCLLVFGLVDSATQGGFGLNVLSPQRSAYSMTEALYLRLLLLCFWPIVLPISGAEIVYTLRDELRRVRGTDGVARQSFWAGVALVRLPLRGTIRQTSLLVLVLCQLVWAPFPARRLQASLIADWRRLPEYDRLFEVVKKAAREGPVLTYEHEELVVLAGQDLHFDSFEREQARLAGLWEPTALVDEIKAHRFPLVLLSPEGSGLREERWAPQILEAILECYEDTGQLHELSLKRPRWVDY